MKKKTQPINTKNHLFGTIVFEDNNSYISFAKKYDTTETKDSCIKNCISIAERLMNTFPNYKYAHIKDIENKIVWRYGI